MKPNLPDNSLDELMAAAVHGELTPAEQTAFDARLKNDPAAHAAYLETQLMHDLLEKTNREAQPDPAFEQRMVSAVRRKIENEGRAGESAWESVLFFWAWLKGLFVSKWRRLDYGIVGCFGVLVFGFILAIRHDMGLARSLGDNGISNPSPSTPLASFIFPKSLFIPDLKRRNLADEISKESGDYVETAKRGLTLAGYVDTQTIQFAGKPEGGSKDKSAENQSSAWDNRWATKTKQEPEQSQNVPDTSSPIATLSAPSAPPSVIFRAGSTSITRIPILGDLPVNRQSVARGDTAARPGITPDATSTSDAPPSTTSVQDSTAEPVSSTTSAQAKVTTQNGLKSDAEVVREFPYPKSFDKPADISLAPDLSRKLIRNAQLDLEVKSYQVAVDAISALTKTAGGYVDTSNSQRGGNGKLQGSIVVKILPQNLDGFLLKLRDLGEVKNQSVSTDDVTKAYYDTQARLDNSRRMETQLQELLKRDNGKVSELLQVERELGRVRGDIEQMQGELKVYDFQVQYATVSLTVQEKDLNQAAAYLLQEQDTFSLFATDVESAFQSARKAADDCKAHILNADLNHNSGSDISAQLVVSVPPDQIEAFLAEVRTLGRVANFTRATNRVARDGGNTDEPADETRTEKDRVTVNLSIHSDDESRKQVAMTVVTPAVDEALERAKTATLASPGAEIVSSSLNKAAQGQSTAQLTVRVPGKNYAALLEAFRALGRTASFSLQRDDNAGPNAAGDDAPVILALSLTDDETPVQETQVSVRATEVDAKAQALKKDAAAAGVEVKASSFERQPDGMEMAQLTFRLPLAKYGSFLETLKNLGKVETLTVHREDRPDQARTDDSAPAEITLNLHNEGEIVTDDNGLWATLRRTFGEGAAALFGSVRVIGVLVAFLLPWAVLLAVAAWAARRIYVARRRPK